MVAATVTGVDVKLFNCVRGIGAQRQDADGSGNGEEYLPMTLSIPAASIGKETLLVARNFDVWRQIVNVRPDLAFIKKSYSKFVQNFASLIDSPLIADLQNSHNISQGKVALNQFLYFFIYVDLALNFL